MDGVQKYSHSACNESIFERMNCHLPGECETCGVTTLWRDTPMLKSSACWNLKKKITKKILGLKIGHFFFRLPISASLIFKCFYSSLTFSSRKKTAFSICSPAIGLVGSRSMALLLFALLAENCSWKRVPDAAHLTRAALTNWNYVLCQASRPLDW